MNYWFKKKKEEEKGKIESVNTHQILAAKQNFYHHKSINCKYEQKYIEINTLLRKKEI